MATKIQASNGYIQTLFGWWFPTFPTIPGDACPVDKHVFGTAYSHQPVVAATYVSSVRYYHGKSLYKVGELTPNNHGFTSPVPSSGGHIQGPGTREPSTPLAQPPPGRGNAAPGRSAAPICSHLATSAASTRPGILAHGRLRMVIDCCHQDE